MSDALACERCDATGGLINLVTRHGRLRLCPSCDLAYWQMRAWSDRQPDCHCAGPRPTTIEEKERVTHAATCPWPAWHDEPDSPFPSLRSEADA